MLDMPHNCGVDVDLTGLAQDSWNPHASNPSGRAAPTRPEDHRQDLGYGSLELWTAPAGGIRLQWVSATQLGDYELRWEEANEEGESQGGFRTLLDVDGKTLLEPELVQAPFAACVTPPSPCTL